ncbi:acyl carrier protein [Streptomyces mirabilis]|uniref:acyl carrier protein n=1 Tax=Streptomyces mirabilis TaxID=68239 RepID=UPI002F91237E
MTAVPSTGPVTTEVTQEITGIVRGVLERDEIDPAVDLFEQGATSLAFIRIVSQLNERYDITADVASLEEASIEALAELISAQLQTSRR